LISKAEAQTDRKPTANVTRSLGQFYLKRNNSDCAIALKFAKEFHHVTGDTLHMFQLKGQRSRSQRKVMYQQRKSYNTATDRFSDFKFGMAS